MIDNARHLFDIPEGITYLNCAGQSPLLRAARAAGEAGIDIKSHPWTLDPDRSGQCSDRLRALFAGLINAQAQDIAITPSTAYGIATAAGNLSLERGQSIVVLEEQFPSNVYAWERLAAEKGGEIVTVARPADCDWTPHVLEQITAKTAIAALPPCHWQDGSTLDLVRIGARCREVGAALVVDATQAVGVMELDVAAIQPDFLACSAYKWLLSPYSLGFFYAAPHRQQGRRLELHQQNSFPRDPESGEVKPREGGLRYDMGERNNFISLPMAEAAMEQVAAWGPAAIQASLKPLTDHAAALAEERGWRVPPAGRRVGHIIGVTPSGDVPADTVKRLAANNVFVIERGPGLRVSPYLYNDLGDIERFFEVLDRCLK